MTDRARDHIRGIPPPRPMPAPFDIRAAGEELLGTRWQPPLAHLLGVNIRTVQRWAAGQNAVPEPIAARISEMLAIVRQCRAEADAERARRDAEMIE